MAVWFDVTDLSIWDKPQLTGIQRTVVNVLAELLLLRDDVRLFRYNPRLGDIEEVHGSTLPPAICRRVFGKTLERPQRRQLPVKRASVHALPTTKPVARPIRQTVARLIERVSSEEVFSTLKDCWRDVRRLHSAVHRSLRKPQARLHAEERLPSPRSANPPRKSFRPLFQPQDVCLSTGATWGFNGYSEAIARHKASGSIICINLIYDLIPTLFPQWVEPGASRLITLWVRQQIANADLILTISDFQRKEIETYIRQSTLPSPPVRAIRLGDDAKLLSDSVPPLPRMIPSRPFILCVSSLDVRKNQLCLYQVWRRLAQELGRDCPELLLVGVRHHHASDLLYQVRHDPLVNGLIAHLRDVNDAELAWYYRNCLFTLYPSVYEGWGLPVGESLAHGKYCISSNAASLPEVGGTLVDYFDPLDFMECYRMVRRGIADRAYVEQKEALIRETYQPASWSIAAAQINAHIEAMRTHAVPLGESGELEEAAKALA